MAPLEHEQLSGNLSVTYATTAVSEKFATEPSRWFGDLVDWDESWFDRLRAGIHRQSATSRQLKPRQTSTRHWNNRPWPHNLNQTASGKPGAVQAGPVSSVRPQHVRGE